MCGISARDDDPFRYRSREIQMYNGVRNISEYPHIFDVHRDTHRDGYVCTRVILQIDFRV